ncbi:permease [Saccharicrinis aurantiacus]|uniref:permease n=1 Tax=Saccharicrinis aurantiacus TaxID=1849719 RepID=UPI0008390432|nr:permease [Saccharicrinis aurantiacus]
MQYIYQFFQELISITNEMAPYLLLGFFFAGVLKVWFPQKWINRYMGKNNLMSVINTALLGIPLPLCSCGVIPTGISFYKNGASKGSSVSFLISTPQTGVDSVLVSYSLLGLPFAIIRVIVALITGVLGGVLTNAIDKEEKIEVAPIKSGTKKTDHSLGRVLKYGFNEFLMDIAKWLIIGLLIAAALATIIPDNFFIQYINNEPLSMLMVLLASIPLYVCATASVPIAAILMMKGLSPGAALIFLMAGPATNAATITVIKKVFGNKTLFSYLFSIIGGAIAFGFLINHFLPSEWFSIAQNEHMHHNHEMLPFWFKILSSLTLVGLVIYGYIKRHKKNNSYSAPITNNTSINITNNKPNFNPQQMNFVGISKTAEYSVTGMTCSHCKANVEKNLKQKDGVSTVSANPQKNTVIVTGTSINDDMVKETVNSLGYSYVKRIK